MLLLPSPVQLEDTFYTAQSQPQCETILSKIDRFFPFLKQLVLTLSHNYLFEFQPDGEVFKTGRDFIHSYRLRT